MVWAFVFLKLDTMRLPTDFALARDARCLGEEKGD